MAGCFIIFLYLLCQINLFLARQKRIFAYFPQIHLNGIGSRSLLELNLNFFLLIVLARLFLMKNLLDSMAHVSDPAVEGASQVSIATEDVDVD